MTTSTTYTLEPQLGLIRVDRELILARTALCDERRVRAARGVQRRAGRHAWIAPPPITCFAGQESAAEARARVAAIIAALTDRDTPRKVSAKAAAAVRKRLPDVFTCASYEVLAEFREH